MTDVSDRTFKLTSPHMTGDDVGDWQDWLLRKFRFWGIDSYPLERDNDYGQATRAATASVCHGMGLSSATEAMKDGVTPELRIKLRNARLSPDELATHKQREKDWLPDFRRRYTDGGKVAAPLAKILADSWGYHPPVHDGIDLICLPDAPLFAICDGEVIRADPGGWWGKGAKAAAGHPVSDGDGIIIIRSSVDAGPFKAGLNMCYGHAEAPVVKVGQKVTAGQRIGTAGFANAWHVHFMVNGRSDNRGYGDRDPKPFVDYARQAG